MMKGNKISGVKNKIYPVLLNYGVAKAGIFGSFARGEDKKNSDIDILVEFRGEKSLLDLAGLKLELEKVLCRNVDVLTYNSLHYLIRDKILKEKVDIL